MGEMGPEGEASKMGLEVGCTIEIGAVVIKGKETYFTPKTASGGDTATIRVVFSRDAVHS
jgi:hypothetical protein